MERNHWFALNILGWAKSLDKIVSIVLCNAPPLLGNSIMIRVYLLQIIIFEFLNGHILRWNHIHSQNMFWFYRHVYIAMVYGVARYFATHTIVLFTTWSYMTRYCIRYTGDKEKIWISLCTHKRHRIYCLYTWKMAHLLKTYGWKTISFDCTFRVCVLYWANICRYSLLFIWR